MSFLYVFYSSDCIHCSPLGAFDGSISLFRAQISQQGIPIPLWSCDDLFVLLILLLGRKTTHVNDFSGWGLKGGMQIGFLTMTNLTNQRIIGLIERIRLCLM